jgi:hypothetical protein
MLPRMKNEEPLPWWREGLRFSCIGCGRCCRGEPGAIWVSPIDEERIACWLNIDIPTLRIKNETQRWGAPSLREKEGGACVFYTLETGRCAIYSVRPIQCSLFPFWPHVVRTPQSWEQTAQMCPGMNQGRLYPAREIKFMTMLFPRVNRM